MSTICKRSSLIAIVNRLYMNANNDQVDDDAGKVEEAVTTPNSIVVSREESLSPKSDKMISNPSSTTPIIPLSSEIGSNGLNAVGGCRQCSRTFSDRLSLVHHFVDHFPSIFYSFESSSLSSSALMPIMPTATSSSALGISSVSKKFHPQNSFSKNNGGQQYASGIQSMMFFPLVSLNNNNHQQPPMLPSSQKLQQNTRIKEATKLVEVISKKNKLPKDPKPKNVEKVKESKELNSRFTDFNKTGNDLPYDMCPHCCQTFSDHEMYFEHLKTHETPIISIGDSMISESPLKCEYCDLRFSNEYLLKEHKKIHCRICSICTKTLMTAFDLNLHMGIHSGFSYDCKDCGRCFPDRKTLAMHNKMHRSDLSTPDSDEEKNSHKSTTFLKENVKKSKIEKPSPIVATAEDKPESFFKSNPYFENIFKQNTRKRRQRVNRNSGSGIDETVEKKRLRNA